MAPQPPGAPPGAPLARSAHPARTAGQLAVAGLIVEAEGRTRLGDEFRIAASKLNAAVSASMAALDAAANLVLVTSTRPAEGKSFSSVNLAAAIAATSGREVLLVDADFKPRCLSDLLGLLDAKGLLQFSAEAGGDPGALVVATEVPRLSVMPLGRPLGAAGVDDGQPLAKAAERLSAAFPEAVVILDTGPLLSTSDPSVLAPSVASVVLVIEAGRTQRAEIDAALELVRGTPKVMLLLNKAAAQSTGAFGAYTYGEGYYTHPDVPPPRPPRQPNGGSA